MTTAPFVAGIGGTILSPTIDTPVVVVVVALAVAYGLWSYRDLHQKPWRSAWLALGARAGRAWSPAISSRRCTRRGP